MSNAERASGGEGKVFGIGFHKTGTKSLAAALKYLGYRVTGPNFSENPRIAQEALRLSLELVPHYDAFQDNPWPVLYRELHREFPQAKFILTLRPTAAWIASVVRHFGATTTPMREWIYGLGSPRGNEQLYVSRYEAHNRGVLAYFQEASARFLVFRITDGQEWRALCPFLGKEIPAIPFPHENPAEARSGS